MSRTLGIGPIGIQIRQRCLITDLLKGLGWLVVDLEDTARSPPTGARVVPVGHVEVDAPASRRALRIVARVEGDGALEENWGRQLGGIAGDVVGRRLVKHEGSSPEYRLGCVLG